MSRFTKSPDEPITSQKEDKFGREKFANSVAEALVKVPKQQSMTVGLYGSWGSGKTSIINMAIDYLTKKYTDKVVVIKFNPWIFSSTESLHLAFFSTLASRLDTKLYKGKHSIGELLRKYAKLTGPLSDTVGMFFPPASWPTRVASILSSFGKTEASSSEKVDIDETRHLINELLSKSGKRIVVVIDDIDRLDSDEIHQVFKLVKNVAHFQNISYLLAFDQVVVAKALSNRYPSNPKIGGNFIDKIVQLPLYVPTVDQSLLNKYLTEELDRIIAQNKLDASEEDISRFQSVYFVRDGQDLFDTPRKVVRFLNTVDFSIERLGDETSFTDTVLVDMLRNFFPELYMRTANNKELLLGQGHHGRREEEEKKLLNKTIFGNEDPTSIEVTIVKELFPTVEWAFGGAGYAGDFIRGWEKARRICTEKYFNRYFAYDIPVGDVADAKIQSLLNLLSLPKTTKAQAEKQFRSIVKDSDSTIVISKLRSQEESLSETVSEKLSQVLISVDKDLPRPKQALAGDMLSPYIQSAVLAVKLTRHTQHPYSLLESYIKEVPVNYAAEILRWARVNSEKSKDSGEDFVPLLSSNQVENLGRLVAERIKKYTKTHYIQVDFPDDVAHLMWIWKKWGEKSDIQKYFTRSFNSSNDRAIEFLMSYVSDAWSIETGIKTRSDFRREAYDEIAKLVDPGIFVKPLIQLFGKEVNEGDYESYRSNKNNDDKFRIAQQFLYMHRTVTSENKSSVNRKTDIIDGEVVDKA
jgi:predicted KAP-like P-loop ATPase